MIFSVLAGGAATPALAQHVVTDDEASKLTLDALTATPAPVVRHVVYHAPSRHSAHYSRTAQAHASSHAVVRNVAYKRLVHVSPAGKSGDHHGKRRRG
ncbi:hypothetical protein NFI95_00290 [Acetobacteraceae bacterium KSS8]|uniref:Uncharacterized protein n=1 Tax=Endosaccharibacter trunci TaxID=2812733 RepID=A0ABT1W4W3_9PROT|nr:hypothetical protein [Acetobacteraceae bacterium KSS8]